MYISIFCVNLKKKHYPMIHTWLSLLAIIPGKSRDSITQQQLGLANHLFHPTLQEPFTRWKIHKNPPISMEIMKGNMDFHGLFLPFAAGFLHFEDLKPA
jgi:hypothetical protein